MKKRTISLAALLVICVYSCQSTSFFYNESANETYTELQLNSNGTFAEYFYYNLDDSLQNADFGNIIDGTYTEIGDTLYLVYQPSIANATVEEVYLKSGVDLIKLEPVTYSHHFLNMVFTEGKSPKLRALKNYNSIAWKKGL
jgi:hypothetical protein